MPELNVRTDTRRYLEFVVNRYGLNPRPALSLFVEGKSEEAALRLIFKRYFGAEAGKYGIEITPLHGVGNATGNQKDDRFRAILRLVDYLHHHQTFAFIILDNENEAAKLKREARKAVSIHHSNRHITRQEYICVWKDSFEFDNFSASEIAAAMVEISQGNIFSSGEVSRLRKSKNPGAALSKLYESKAGRGLNKVRLSEVLVDGMLSSQTKRKTANRPIIKTLRRVIDLAKLNRFPTMQETSDLNQASKYLGKKRRKMRATP